MESNKEKVTITIDGKKIEAEAGKNLVEVASENNVFIPSLCYFPEHEQPTGVCRVCTCSVDGNTKIACTQKVKEGMEIEVDRPDLNNARKAIVEMMFSEGNHFCPSCEKSGNCDLQHMAYEMRVSTSRFPHLFKDRLVDFTPKRMIIEHNRCIKCMRCVEEVKTDEGKPVFSYCNRGNETILGVDYEEEAKLSEAQAMRAMELCPTGAILIRGKSLGTTFGDRKFDEHFVNKEIPVPILQSPKAPEEKTGKKVIATISLAGCFGCHMSMLDIDLGILDILDLVEFNKSPLTDIKKFSKRCHLGLIEGGCCNSENVEVLRAFREKCDILISVGECAIWGGVPAMRNMIPLEECLEESYLNAVTNEADNYIVPYDEDLPKILDRVYACNEIVKIDYHIPGCPPSADHIWKVVKNILFDADYSVLYSEFKYD